MPSYAHAHAIGGGGGDRGGGGEITVADSQINMPDIHLSVH